MKRAIFGPATAGALLGTFLLCVCGWPQAAKHSTSAGTKATQAAGPEFDWKAPLPSAAVLKKRVMENLKKSQAEQERYVCKTLGMNEETDKNGNVKHRDVKQYDMFFVNGQEIDETTSRNGKPLSEEQKKKESEKVQKEIKKDSDEKYVAKQDANDAKQFDTALRMLRYTNGHRIDVNGRPTLSYDMVGDPKVHPKGMEETFLHSMTGTIQIDELTGQLVDLNMHLDHDVKVGGGLLANLHKGFWLHLQQQRYPDGVWLLEKVEGTGDARAALFFHPYFRFSRTMSGCALTNVTTSQGATTLAK